MTPFMKGTAISVAAPSHQGRKEAELTSEMVPVYTPHPGEVWVDREFPDQVSIAILGVQDRMVSVLYSPSGRTSWLSFKTLNQLYSFDHDTLND